MSSLTVLCPTRDPGPQVRAALEPLRAVADEILIAVDSRAGESELGEYAAIADRLLRFERGEAHSALAWLHAECRGDWVFTLAGDEVPGRQLLAALPELVRSREAVHHQFPVYWLWPTPERWLSGSPWHPDFHPRLVRNDGTLRLRGAMHEEALPAFPTRYHELPIWHLNLILLSESERRAKVERNQESLPGLVAPGGSELNQAYYLPEDVQSPPTEPVSQDDLVLIRSLLDAAPSGAPPPAPVQLATRAEIEPLWAGRSVDDAALDGAVELFAPEPLRFRPGEHRTIYLRVRNESGEHWPGGLDLAPLIRLGYRWDAPGSPEGRAAFPGDLPPGEERIVPTAVVAPIAPGSHRLELGLLLEDVRWFGRPCVLDVTVSRGGR